MTPRRSPSTRPFSRIPLKSLLGTLFALAVGWASGGLPPRASADDSAAAATTTDLVGITVDVKLQSGKTLLGVTVEEAKAGKIAGTIIKLRVFNPKTKSRLSLAAAAVEKVTTADGECRLIFDKPSRSLAPPDKDALDAIHKAMSAGRSSDKAAASAASAKHRPTKSRKEDPAAEAERLKKKAAEQEAFFKKTGVRLWPELSDEEQQAALARRKEYLEKVAKQHSSLNMELHETKYFLLLSSVPPQLAKLCETNLDAMHEQLCKVYAIERPDKLWLGKAVVVAFNRKEDFMQFEQVFFHQRPPANVQGAANAVESGEDVIGCYCGDDPVTFAHVLVHETTHGFNHRYLSPLPLPNWLDEGIAEWIAITIVKSDKRDVRPSGRFRATSQTTEKLGRRLLHRREHRRLAIRHRFEHGQLHVDQKPPGVSQADRRDQNRPQLGRSPSENLPSLGGRTCLAIRPRDGHPQLGAVAPIPLKQVICGPKALCSPSPGNVLGTLTIYGI